MITYSKVRGDFMKHFLSMLIILLTLTACASNNTISTLQDPSPDQFMSVTENGIALSLGQTIFHGSPSVIATTVKNNSDVDYNIGDFYHLEIKKDNLWYIITYSDKIFYENQRFKDFGQTLFSGDEIQQVFSVEQLDILLPPGEYRLVKSLSSQDEHYYEVMVAAEFIVE